MWVCLLVLASAWVGDGRPALAQAADAGTRIDDATYIVFEAASGANTVPVAMSATGAITGRFFNPGPGIHGFMRTSRGELITFDAPGSSLTFPAAINAAGVITGSYSDSNNRSHAFIRRTDGGFKTFDVPGASNTGPTSINASGTITGSYGDANHVFHGFLRNAEGQFIAFDAPEADQRPFSPGTAPVEIQDDGTILGYFVDTNEIEHGFLRSPKGSITIFDPPGQISAIPFNSYGPSSLSINPAGVITGAYYEASSGNFRGFILNRDDTFTTFDGADYPPCCAWTFPFAISAGGIIAGNINDGNGINRGFVRARDGSTTIFDAPNAGKGYGLGTFPTAITPDGKMIMGLDVDSSDVSHGFVRLAQ
ncbi:MAG TPA: hypothetical protein VGR45_16100 [Stellaceae bacterium]|nr:hypothetical protein [Stellaceae bacterium]